MRAVPELASALHDFWFGELLPGGVADAEHSVRWFQPDSAFDEALRERFGATLEALPQSIDPAWCTTPLQLLAGILLRDQLPRNLFRGSARAFHWDAQARQLCFMALNSGADRALGLDQRAFCYMPLMHSERLRDQYLAVGLFASLRDAAVGDLKQKAGNYLRHAQQHRDTVLEYGRFPYRNAALGRTSTPAELEFLSRHGG